MQMPACERYGSPTKFLPVLLVLIGVVGAACGAAADDTSLPWAADFEAAVDNAPQLTAYRCDPAPRIDGNPNDDCWRMATPAVDFVTLGQHRTAAGATQATICYDNSNLYVMFRAEEPLLEPADQRQHEFVAKQTHHDGEIYRDASCAVFIAPRAGGTIFEIGANALATLVDARSQPDAIWTSRDLSWTSGAQAAAKIHDGYWTLELAIPLHALNTEPPEAGSSWRIALARCAAARREYATWQRSGAGIHAPEQFGRIVFRDNHTPASVQFVPLRGELQPGTNELAVTLGETIPPDGLYIYTAVESLGQLRYAYSFVDASSRNSTFVHRFDVPADASQVRLAYGALDTASRQPLYRSSSVARAVQSNVVTLVLSTPQPYEVRMNGRVLRSGDDARGVRVTLPIREGINDVSVFAHAGLAELDIQGMGLDMAERQWTARPGRFDDGPGQVAERSADHRFGAGDEPTTLSHTILWREMRLWPNEQVYLARDATQHLTFLVDGVEDRPLTDWSGYVALPLDVDAVTSSGFYGTTVAQQPIFEMTPIGERTINGRPMQVVRIDADKPIRHGRHAMMSLFHVLVRPKADAASDALRPLYYWSAADDGTVTEPMQRGSIRLLPALDGRQPKRFVIELWGGYFQAMDSEAARRATLATSRAAGVTSFVAGREWTSDVAAEYGLKTKLTVDFLSQSFSLRPYLDAHPDARLIDRDGRTQEHLVCTSQLIGDAWPDFAAMLIEYIGAIEPDVVEYDFEYSVIDGPHACYCDRCIDAFVAHGGLGSSEGLDAAIIVRDHEEAWIDFMTTQSTALFVLMRQAVHDHPHPMQFGVYSGYQNRRTQRRYGVDWRKVGRAGATDLAGFGYGRPIDDIAATHDALPHTHTVFGAIVRPCRTHKQTAPHQISPAQLLRRAIDARDGVLIFDRLAMDGRTWFAISQLSCLAFAYESLLIDGERREVDGQRERDAAWLQSDTATLLCLMNETDAPRTFDIRLPTRLGPGTRFDTGDTVRGRWRITLDAGQFGVLVFESNERSMP